jgi:hypothetical protein
VAADPNPHPNLRGKHMIEHLFGWAIFLTEFFRSSSSSMIRVLAADPLYSTRRAEFSSISYSLLRFETDTGLLFSGSRILEAKIQEILPERSISRVRQTSIKKQLFTNKKSSQSRERSFVLITRGLREIRFAF